MWVLFVFAQVPEGLLGWLSARGVGLAEWGVGVLLCLVMLSIVIMLERELACFQPSA
ncbi:hypothetical protein POL68_24600 [Stigmatella sp. ncwal1]|uniref:Uncharacterized protein n=1 Tax=Stigmatella ashevillensis TaxID=2995309 RepID=A0ABT5DDF8_9BACT|nr:hypothetical protein [Stigmatella ashevillena]MDC0711671.1 hypothetical protein [Stigmatella ashevillena]